MSEQSTRGYEAPHVTEYGNVEDLTQDHNKSTLGTDSDIQSINLAGSVHFQ